MWAKTKGFWRKGRRANITDDVMKYTMIRSVKGQRRSVFIEDPLEDNDSYDSITKPRPAKRISLIYFKVPGYLPMTQNNAYEEQRSKFKNDSHRECFLLNFKLKTVN